MQAAGTMHSSAYTLYLRIRDGVQAFGKDGTTTDKPRAAGSSVAEFAFHNRQRDWQIERRRRDLQILWSLPLWYLHQSFLATSLSFSSSVSSSFSSSFPSS
eukprot:GHVT01077964.1.p2 GENE.GHVT01077964.1~~GHVT01077964.1.p2  ORF type:complete len:101 (-),score=11.89 GHVT01077964.1:549-851(-)